MRPRQPKPSSAPHTQRKPLLPLGLGKVYLAAACAVPRTSTSQGQQPHASTP